MIDAARSRGAEAGQSAERDNRFSLSGGIQDRPAGLGLLRLLMVVVVMAGIWFRSTNLDRKIYWNDEVWTSLWLSGHTRAEMRREFFDSREVGPRDVWHYLRVRPGRGIGRTLLAVATDDPNHPPLYYALLRTWVGVFGDSIRAIRGFSAAVGVLALAGIYFLCLELFRSRRVAGIAMALMAVSPFHLLYAQEARPYGLWTVATLLSSAALLRALRLRTRRDWGIYAATVAMGAYSHYLFGMVIAGHGSYVLCGGREFTRHRKPGLSKTRAHYLLATIAGLLTLVPWAVIVLLSHSQDPAGEAWVFRQAGPLTALRHVTFGIEWCFLDISGVVSHRVGGHALHWSTYAIALLILTLTGYALHFLGTRAPRRACLFVWTLAGATATVLVLPDLLLGGRYLSTPRFLVPLFLGLQLAVAYLLARTVFSRNALQRGIGRAILTLVLLGGFASCLAISRAETWWSKYFGAQNIPMANSINPAVRPLVISDSSGSSFTNAIALCRLLEPKVRLRLVAPQQLPVIPPGFGEVFLFRPSSDLRESIEKQARYHLEPIGTDGLLWRISREPHR